MGKLTNVFFNRRMAACLILGLSSGLPLSLTGRGSTFQTWMASEGVKIQAIGLFAWVSVPWSFKFLWAPLMDRFVPPFMGRRRGWVLICQLALFVALIALSLTSPSENITLTLVLALLVAFAAASQDIVVDAYRTEVLDEEERGPGSSLYVTGYRIGMLVSGGLALILADHLPWRAVYWLMAALILACIAMTAVAPEPTQPAAPPRSLVDAVFSPLIEFFKRRTSIEMLFFVFVYRTPEFLAVAFTTLFMLDVGFTKSEIGAVVKTFGLTSTIVGSIFGGALMTKLGMRRSLLLFGAAQAIAAVGYFLLATVGRNYPIMVSAVLLDNFFNGMASVAFSAFLMELCDRRFTASQYALLTSLMALGANVVTSAGGFLKVSIGWQNYFLVAGAMVVVPVLMILRYDRWSLGSVAVKQ